MHLDKILRPYHQSIPFADKSGVNGENEIAVFLFGEISHNCVFPIKQAGITRRLHLILHHKRHMPGLIKQVIYLFF